MFTRPTTTSTLTGVPERDNSPPDCFIMNPKSFLPKYNGCTDAILWIQLYQSFGRCYGLTDADLMRYVYPCLRGAAKTWFLDNIKVIVCWEQFEDLFKEEFFYTEAQKHHRLHTRKKRPTEDVYGYVLDIQRKFRRLYPDGSEHSLKTFIMNGLPKSLQKLADTCQDYDDFVEQLRVLENRQIECGEFIPRFKTDVVIDPKLQQQCRNGKAKHRK